MEHLRQFYIDGAWVEPFGEQRLSVIDPSTEASLGEVALGDARDIDCAVAAAERAFVTFSQTSIEERVALLERILVQYDARYDEMAELIMREIGAPSKLSHAWQAALGRRHIEQPLRTVAQFPWQKR